MASLTSFSDAPGRPARTEAYTPPSVATSRVICFLAPSVGQLRGGSGSGAVEPVRGRLGGAEARFLKNNIRREESDGRRTREKGYLWDRSSATEVLKTPVPR